jgi:hypothetical protein
LNPSPLPAQSGAERKGTARQRPEVVIVSTPNPIPYVTDSLEKVPESVRPYFVETDDGGVFRLLVDGVAPKEKFEEFRSNNTDLNKRLAEAERQMTVYRAINEDPDKLKQDYDRLLKLEQRFKDKDLIDKDGFEKAVEQRTSEMKSASEGQIRALSEALNKAISERDQAIQDNERIIIHRAITDAALAAKAIPGAIPNILDQAARDGWTLNDKKQPIMMRNGEIVFGENGVDPLSPKEWAARSLHDSCPWFFNTAAGTGATGNSVPGGPTNPWTRDNWNLTKQGEYIQKEGLAKAEAMARAAGSSITAIHPPKAA